MKRSEAINELAAALAKAQGDIQPAVKDKTNPHYKSSYADLASCWDAIRAPLSKNGLSVIQGSSTIEDGVKITTILMHTSGQWFEEDLIMIPRDDSPQAAGSAITYGRRYSLMGMVGISPGDDDEEEDDGHAATLPTRKTQNQKPQVQPKQAQKPDVLPPEGARDKSKMPATEQQRKFVYALMKGNLGFDDALAKKFMFEETGKDSGKDLTMADVDKIAAGVEREVQIKKRVQKEAADEAALKALDSAGVSDAAEPPEPGTFEAAP